MSGRNLFNERFGMLMACASPGSAWAYHLGSAAAKPELVQRSSADELAQTRVSGVGSRTNWLERAFDRLEQWSWERQMKSQEAYLSQATDLCDLEARIRQLDSGDGLSRSHALR
jgi:Protein of unknown function (DUF3563)